MGIPRKEMFDWTDDRVALLKNLSADGLSGSQIARELGGGLSRNAVMGKLDRLGLRVQRRRRAPFIPKPKIPSADNPKVQRPRIGSNGRMTMVFDVPCNALTDLPADESPDAVPFLARTSGCRWPLNETVPIDEHMVCGTKCHGDHSYCARQFRLSINSNRAQTMNLSEAERARRVAQGRKNRQARKDQLAAS